MNTEQIVPPTESLESQDGLVAPPSEPTKAKKHPVIELFGPVIQGEGSQAGNQTLFIRFGGCDYRCERCDSLHAVIPDAVIKNAHWLEPTEIAAECLRIKDETGVQWVTFSGGNPLMHKLDELVGRLTMFGFYINVETQGTLWQDWLYNCTLVTVSPKSWGMGEKFEENKYRRFLARLNGCRPLCVKVVVFSEQDLEFALSIQEITQQEVLNWLYGGPEVVSYYLSLGNPYPPVLDEEFNAQNNPNLKISDVPLTTQLLMDYRRLSEELLQDRRLKAFRFLPQLHVLVYGNEARR